jgi:outer membrane protein assembly factor BamB
MRYSRTLATALLVLATGCSGGTRQPGAGPGAAAARPPGDLAVLSGADGMRVVDLATGRTLAAAGSAMPTPDGTALVGTTDGGAVAVVDTRTGASTSTPGRPGLVPRAVSEGGRLVALAAPDSPAPDGYLAGGRTRSTIVVNDTSGRTQPRTYNLKGNYLPEAFSAGGTHLFLVEYLPPAAPNRYRVRQLDLATGTVAGVLGPLKAPLDEQMRGVGRMQVLDRQRTALHTLYRTIGTTRAFVHTLQLTGMWAHCVVLPEPVGAGGDATAIALAPDGTLYAWDASAGVLALVDPLELAVRRTVAIRGTSPFRSAGADSSAAVTVAKDGTIFASSGSHIFEVDGGTLTERALWEAPGAVTSLAVSTDGGQLLALADNNVVVLGRADHHEVARWPADGATAIAAVLPPAD